MAINPMDLMKLRSRLDTFQRQHPRFPAFLKDVGENAVMPGTVLEIKVTTPEGRELVSNIRLTEEDVETINMARSQH